MGLCTWHVQSLEETLPRGAGDHEEVPEDTGNTQAVRGSSDFVTENSS